MLNATQTNDAINEMSFDKSSLTSEEIRNVRANIKIITKEIEEDFNEYLGHTHAQGLSDDVKKLIWEQACMQSNGSGYFVIEDNYADLATLIKKVKALPAF